MTISDTLIYFVVAYESIVGTGSLYMLYLYVIKPLMKFKNNQIKQEGTVIIADMHMFRNGVYSGTMTNFNMTEFADEIVNKVTGAIPQNNLKDVIRHQIREGIGAAAAAATAEALSNEDLQKGLTVMINRIMDEELNGDREQKKK